MMNKKSTLQEEKNTLNVILQMPLLFYLLPAKYLHSSVLQAAKIMVMGLNPRGGAYFPLFVSCYPSPV